MIPQGRQIIDFERLQCDNGSITRNWKVTKIELFGNANDGGFWVDPPNSADIVFFYLAYRPGAYSGVPSAFADLRNSNQFAWAAVAGVTLLDNIHTVIDPGHIITEDLYITAYAIDSGTGSTQPISSNLQYLITIEEVTTTEAEGVLAQVRAKSHH